MPPEIRDAARKTGAALVVGAGVAGMQASLDLTAAGIKVYLSDSKPAIGGVMAQLDKTFPTNDCAMCNLAPRLVEVGRNADIEIHTLSQVERVEGEAGNFRVTLRKAPRFVDESRCTGCSACVDACPVTQPAEFEGGLTTRKAIYRLFPQAVPNVFAISRRGVSPCQAACPIHQSAQGYVALIAQRRFDEALQVIIRENPLPSICGRICTHPCAINCTRQGVDDAVNLPALKRFVVDRFPNYELPRPEKERPEKIAIVGSGPAGLTCAYHLRQMGYQTVIFEALPVAGGMLAVGVPPFRLPRPVLNADLDRLRAIGVDIRVDHPVGRKVKLEDLRKEYQAVFLGIGSHVERKLRVPGEDLQGVISGLEFLRHVNLEQPYLPGRRMIVIGGGNSALDTARTALRCGAEEVTLVYRRTRAEMPADPREVDDAEREGVKLMFLAAPKEFIAGAGGRVASVQLQRMKLGAPDASGRPAPEPIAGSEFALSCDAAVVTIGHSSDIAGLGETIGLDSTKWGTLTADPVTMETNVPAVFAGGDCVTGPDVVVTAMAAGKKAAISIDRRINGKDLRSGRELEATYRTEYTVDTAGVLTQRQLPVPSLDAGVRGRTFDEVHLGYPEGLAVAEAQRCLTCGICSDCRRCETACKADAIDFSMKEEHRQIDVGAILLATGFEALNPAALPGYGYGRFPNVLTGIEFERVLSASGPYGGQALRPSDKQHPKKIAFIQCVGSRDSERDYCSSVCCMYATKQALIAKEHLGRDLQCDIFFMDLRAQGKGFEQYYQRAQEQGVRYIRSRIPYVAEVQGSRNLQITWLDEHDAKRTNEYDLVVLATAMKAPASARELANTFGSTLNDFGFFDVRPFTPVSTARKGVYVAGALAGPKDIPETVTQASAAAAQVLADLAEVRGTLIAPKSYPPEKDVKGKAPRVGVFVCHCGTNIAGVVDVPSVVEYAKGLPNVVFADRNLFTCSNDTQDRIRQVIAEEDLNRVVIASCTPRTHEPLFRNTLREAGLNPYLMEMANIRDQCSWVHMQQPEEATEKAKDLVRIAVAKARMLEPLTRLRVAVDKSALVLGGGLSGMTAALALARQGFDVHLVEKEKELGGSFRDVRYLFNGDRPDIELARLRTSVGTHPRVHVLTGATVQAAEGTIGNFRTTIAVDGRTEEIRHGVVIIATGAKPYEPMTYLYGKNPNVITQRELEKRLASGDSMLTGSGGQGRTLVMIQCVGSRDEEHPYCSRVCCSEAVKNALKIKALSPDANVYVLYRDMRTYGFSESYYTQARRQGVIFMRYEDRKPEVTADGERLRVSVVDATLDMPVDIEADTVVLSTGIAPNEENRQTGQFFKVPVNSEGFFLEAHMKLRPVDFATDGVFLCGLAHAPKNVEERVIQAQAAAGRASTILARDEIELEANVAEVIHENCDGCAYCVDTCPYHAITLIEYMWQGVVKRVVENNETVCKGCGCCQGTCPKHGIFVRGFAPEQIAAQIDAALGVGV